MPQARAKRLPAPVRPSRRDLRAALPRQLRPPAPRQVRLPGLEAPVALCRDPWGIAHLRAAAAQDAFLAQGYVTALDRLWQMEYDRRRAQGRVAELLGAAALPADLQMRRFQVLQAACEQLEGLAPETRDMLRAYCAGINAFIQAGPPWGIEFALLGLEPEPWQPQDCLAVLLVRHILMGVWEGKAWRARLVRQLGPEVTAALYPGYPPGDPVIVPPGGSYHGPPLDGLAALAQGLTHVALLKETGAGGSNNWVIGGSRTRSGKPLLAGDPHRALEVPNVYYPNHVACPEFDVVGFSFPGVPGFPHFGHNARVAWGITHGEADTQDLFIEQFNPARPLQYRWGEQWLEARVTRQQVRVRGARPVTLQVLRTRHGPIIAGGPEPGQAPASPFGLAFQYTATQPGNRTMDAIRRMLRAPDADALEAALQPWVDPVNNLVYADVAGQFGYRTRGQVPLRPEANHWLPVPGWSGAHEWRGMIPFAEMPHVRNPAAGFACTANNRITDERYPHTLSHEYAPPFRAQRILAHLSQGQGLAVPDMARIHGDVLSLPALAWRPLWPLVQPGSRQERQALAVLLEWDGQVRPQAAGATLFHATRDHLVRLLLEPLLGSLAQTLFQTPDRGGNGLLISFAARLHEEVAQGRTRWLPPGGTWPALLSRAFGLAVRHLARELGPGPASWRWERLHRTRAQHPLALHLPHAAAGLNPPAVGLGGDGETVMAGGGETIGDLRAYAVSVARYVFDCADWERSRWIIPGGASGHPASPHWQDQLAVYARRETLPMLYGWRRIARVARSAQRLLPAESPAARRPQLRRRRRAAP